MSRAGWALLLVLSGCAANITYAPRWPLAAPATRFVSLDVVNARPPDEGGDNPRQVGIARGGYGNPTPFEQEKPDDLTRLIREATVDALHGAGLEEQGTSNNRLRARILKFWMDGYVGYAAHVTIEYSLLDPTGNPLWTQKVEGHEAGSVFSYSAASGLLTAALAHAASQATAQFKEPAFQTLLPPP